MWYVLIALLLVAAVAYMYIARRQQWETWTILQANKEIYESRLKELEDDLEQGAISPKDMVLAKQELQKTFVTEIDNPDDVVEHKPANVGVITLILVVLAGGLYLWAGSWQQQQQADRAWDTLPKLSEWLLGDESAAPQSDEEFWEYALGLRQRLMDDPEPNAWTLYGRMMMQLQQIEQALESFERSYRLEADNISNLTVYSQALILSGSDNDLARANRFLGRVLQLDSRNIEAFGLMGVVHFERADYERAVTAWDMALRLMGENDPRYASIQNSLQQAQDRLEGNVMTLTVNVDISETLRNEMPWTATLYVFVRDPDGGSAPIAVTRQRVMDFPVTVTLTDEDMMLEGASLSNAASWLVGARLTVGDSMERRSGDFEARPRLVERQAGQQVQLVLTELIP
ncbi:c-type cytochrome biogenesis protein CcmI [Aliidiomarina sanyensis]|uniref:C-type cytochrome biogenesis protein CcmI n=1 Tax=Aliidiomarina sanyensis TaxID=1249555 RepID=A0A432WGF2_9GAMM|nr:c-type cytochrome biogenesis protein CcmI [Aliidiomarina sanyensis]RUO32821.1 c-type cytochrome biogenesis protein CcmI [Aliidiomarina sanyensis]